MKSYYFNDIELTQLATELLNSGEVLGILSVMDDCPLRTELLKQMTQEKAA